MQSRGRNEELSKRRAKEKLKPAVRVATRMGVQEFRVAASQGVFRRVRLESDWTRFQVVGELDDGLEVVMWMAKEDNPRKFANPGSALAELRKMGVTRVEVVMAEWDVELAVLSMRQRPDVVARRLQRKRMTYAQQILEAAKTDPEMVRAIPPGTVEMPPVDRAVELDRLVAGKFDEMQRKAEAEHPPEPVKERKKSRAEEEREIAADRAWSDAMAEEVYREAQAARAGSVK